MGFEFVTRRYWTFEALVGYLESLSAYFSCDIGTVKFGKSKEFLPNMIIFSNLSDPTDQHDSRPTERPTGPTGTLF